MKALKDTFIKEFSFTKSLSEQNSTIPSTIVKKLEEGLQVYVWAPTGSGKTYMVNKIAETYTDYNVYLFEPTNSIVTQQLTKAYKSKRLHILNWDALGKTNFDEKSLIFIDEAHFITDIVSYRSDVFKQLLDIIKSDYKVCYLSGTPFREIELLKSETSFVKCIPRFNKQTITVKPINLGSHKYTSYVKSYMNENLFVLCSTETQLKEIQNMAFTAGKTFCAINSLEKTLYQFINNKRSNENLKDVDDRYGFTAAISDSNITMLNWDIENRDSIINSDFKDVNGKPYDIIACTCYCECGIDISWYDGRRIIVDGVLFGARDVIQFASRFRNAESVSVDVVDYDRVKLNNLTNMKQSTFSRISNISIVHNKDIPFDTKIKETLDYSINHSVIVDDVIDDSVKHQERIKEVESIVGKLKCGNTTKGIKHKEHNYRLTKDCEFGLAGQVFTKSQIIEMNDNYRKQFNSMNANFSKWCKRNNFVRVK